METAVIICAIVVTIACVFCCVMLFAIWRAILGASFVNLRLNEAVKANVDRLTVANKNTAKLGGLTAALSVKMQELSRGIDSSKETNMRLSAALNQLNETVKNRKV